MRFCNKQGIPCLFLVHHQSENLRGILSHFSYFENEVVFLNCHSVCPHKCGCRQTPVYVYVVAPSTESRALHMLGKFPMTEWHKVQGFLCFQKQESKYLSEFPWYFWPFSPRNIFLLNLIVYLLVIFFPPTFMNTGIKKKTRGVGGNTEVNFLYTLEIHI